MIETKTQPEPLPPATGSVALSNILFERRRQDSKWGVQNHDMEKWLVILQEECGEAAEAALDNDGWKYRDEMVHVSAVALAAVECFDRRFPSSPNVRTERPGP
jgi:hypothetical protein